MESDGDHFLAYYLTEDDGTAVQFKTERAALPINGTSEDEVGQPDCQACLDRLINLVCS